MVFTKQEIQATAKRTPTERDAIDTYWKSLSKEEQLRALEFHIRASERRKTAGLVVMTIILFIVIIPTSIALAQWVLTKIN